MKNIFFIAVFILFSTVGFTQNLLNEDFQSYQGFGSTLTNGWSTSGVGGFKVYLRTVPGDTAIKVCEAILSSNHKGDSLITPGLGPLAANATLTFKSRLVDTYTGNIAVINHIPASGDKVLAYVSGDGGTTFTFLQDLLPSFPNSGLAFTNFNLPINGFSGNNVKVKFVVSRTAGEWFPSFDNFIATNVTSNNNQIQRNNEVSLYPNPSTGVVLITANGFSNKAIVEVYNILGSKMYSGSLTNGKLSLDLGEMRSGVYLIKVTEGKEAAISRLILK